MKRDKILICVDNLDDINEYEKLDIVNFLFPLENYSIGYNTFSFEEIKAFNSAYILINRLLTDEDIDNFIKLEIPNNIKGFVIEDIGLIDILKSKGYEVILFQNHLNNNYETINYWLKYVDSLVISTDITKEEIKEIIDKADKPLVLNTFLLPMIMYSRRRLVSNFYRHIGKDSKNEIAINEKISNSNFLIKESTYGSAVFNNKILDYRDFTKELNQEKIKFYLFNSAHIDKNTIIKGIKNEKVDNTTTGFLDKKTIYKVGDKRD